MSPSMAELPCSALVVQRGGVFNGISMTFPCCTASAQSAAQQSWERLQKCPKGPPASLWLGRCFPAATCTEGVTAPCRSDCCHCMRVVPAPGSPAPSITLQHYRYKCLISKVTTLAGWWHTSNPEAYTRLILSGEKLLSSASLPALMDIANKSHPTSIKTALPPLISLGGQSSGSDITAHQ